LNKVILIGRLTKDPELRYTPGSGVAVATFTLAVSRPFLNQKGERDTDFIPIVAWRRLAEQCASNLKKGRLIGVSGRLQVRSFETQNGTKRWVTEVVAEEIQFLDKPKIQDSQERDQEALPTGFEDGFNDPDIDLNFDFGEELNGEEDLPL